MVNSELIPFETLSESLAAGLDPKERVRFRNLIEDLGEDNIVLLSTHIVSDIEHIADSDILIMKDGNLIYHDKWDGTKEDLEAFYLEQFDTEKSSEAVKGRGRTDE